MKKFALLLAAVLMTAISADVFAQGIDQTVTINATRNYWVNSTDGTTHNTDHVGNSYTWSVYEWNGTDDYTLNDGSWTPVAAADEDFDYVGANSGEDIFGITVNWLAGGHYVVEVSETNGTTGCITIRRFGVYVLDLDLLVVTKNNDGDIITEAATYCNTDAGNIYGDDDADDLNSASGVDPALGTMTMTYEISLYTAKGSTNASDLIGTALSGAKWKFEVTNNSVIPTLGDVTWTVDDGTTPYTTDFSSAILVPTNVSTITITAQIDNIAAATTDDYQLAFSVSPATVLVENSATHDDNYEEGQEPAAYTGADGSHTNSAYTITVNPIPNTTKIKFD